MKRYFFSVYCFLVCCLFIYMKQTGKSLYYKSVALVREEPTAGSLGRNHSYHRGYYGSSHK